MERDETGRDDGPGLIALLTQLSKSFNRRSTEEMLGMRLKEFLVLSYLRDHLGTTQQELGEAMLLDPNAVVLLLNELESRGHSIRRRDAEDRRRHVVDITPAGREAVARAEKAREVIEDEVLGELSAADRRTLRRILLRALEGQTRTPAAPTLRAQHLWLRKALEAGLDVDGIVALFETALRDLASKHVA